MVQIRTLKLGWVAGGQLLSVLGTVVGLRILTQYLEPATFGAVTLALASAALALGLACTPLTQAAMYFYPTLARQGTASILPHFVWRGLRRALPWLAPGALLAAISFMILGSVSVWLVVATAALFFCDCWRSINLSLLNAAAEHRRYALWMALEAWARPLFATAAVLLISRSAAAVLWAYGAASLVLNLLLSPRGLPAPPASAAETIELDRRMWRYALPLVPLGLMGWANGVSDRYIIGGLLGLTDTGIYAAAYGLASRPMLLVNATFEQFMRPIYQNAVSAGQKDRASLLLRYWLSGVAGVCTVGVIVIGVWRHEWAAIFLGAGFRAGADLMPWIAAGYGLLSLSYVFERINLAHARTRRVLAVEVVSGLAALLLTTTGVHFWGLIGAAVAVPCYFGVQLLSAIILSRNSRDVYQYHPT